MRQTHCTDETPWLYFLFGDNHVGNLFWMMWAVYIDFEEKREDGVAVLMVHMYWNYYGWYLCYYDHFMMESTILWNYGTFGRRLDRKFLYIILFGCFLWMFSVYFVSDIMCFPDEYLTFPRIYTSVVLWFDYGVRRKHEDDCSFSL